MGTRDANETRPPGVRVLELAAREKTCEHPGKACHGDDCPLARGFYDRLPAARDEAVVHGWLDRPALRRIALAHGICPYWLSHDLAQWADVVVGDYNYYFDTSALMRGLALQRQWRVGLLVDEAHNLVDRACAMYSASLRLPTLRAARAGATPALRRTLDAVLRAWRDAFGGQEQGWQAYDTLPAKLLTTLQAASATLGEHLSNPAPPGSLFTHHDTGAELQQLHFDLVHFLRLAGPSARIPCWISPSMLRWLASTAHTPSARPPYLARQCAHPGCRTPPPTPRASRLAPVRTGHLAMKR